MYYQVSVNQYQQYKQKCVVFNIKSVSNLALNRKQILLNKFVEINDNAICFAISGIARSIILNKSMYTVTLVYFIGQ